MNHRHLLPTEIDLVVDGEAGFGVGPLRAHLLECAECRQRFDDTRVVVEAIESLPHLAPDARLIERVMARVPVFVPARVAAGDAVRRWLPQSQGTRFAVAAIGTSMAGFVTLAMIWLALRGDAVMFVSGILGERFRSAVLRAARDLAIAALGESALAALQATGPVGTSLLVLGFLLAALGTVAGIRRLATAGRRV